MKAITLWQPWASLMAAGLKTIETRDWPTRYRGPLAIHAAKRPLGKKEKYLLEEWAGVDLISWDWLNYKFSFGAIVAVVELIDCIRTIDLISSWEWHKDCSKDREFDFGNFVPGRWAWITQNLRVINPSLPWRGSQGLFEIPSRYLEGR